MKESEIRELAGKMPQEVIRDLLPLYVGGEASEASQALVTEYLKLDAELRSQVEADQRAGIDSGGAVRPAFSPEVELRALRRTRALLRWQRISYGWALAFTVASLGGVGFVHGGQIAFRFFFRDYPQVFFPCLSAAASLWVHYFVLRWRLRGTKL